MNSMIVDPLPAGAMTWGGKTSGPAINMGRIRPHMVGGRMFYMHLDELRDCVVKAGWHTESDYQQLLASSNELATNHGHLASELAEAREKIETLEKALGWKPQETNQNGDGADRERELPQGGTTRVAGSTPGAEHSSRKAGSGKGRKVRAEGAEAG